MSDISFTKFQNNKYFSSLDGLRFLSIIGVIWHHTVYCKGFGEYPFLNSGSLGVDLFFAISGFLITTLLLRENKRNGKISLKNFYMRRTLRIFPLYYAVLILLYLPMVYFLENDVVRKSEFFDNLIYFLTYTSNWFVFENPVKGTIFFFAWSLACEEQFYILWSSIEKYFKKTWWIFVAIIFLLKAIIYYNLGPAVFIEDSFFYRVITSFSSAIILGVVFAHLLFYKKYFKIIYRLIGFKFSPLIVFILLFLAVFFAVPKFVIHLFMILFIVSCVIREDHVLKYFLKIKIFVKMGMVSYCMYLTHMICYHLSYRLLDYININSTILTFILTLFVCFGVSWLSFITFEKYFLNFKKSFKS